MTLASPEAQKILERTQRRLRKLTGNKAIVVVSYSPAESTATPLQIIDLICEETGVTMPQVRQQTRKREIVTARELIVYYLRTFHAFHWKKIGEIIGGRDHTTALAACRRLKGLLETNDSIICHHVANINKRLNDMKNAN